MSDFSLSWRPQDYLGIQWVRAPRAAVAAARGFSGIAKGRAVETLFDRRLWHMTAGETEFELRTLVFNLSRRRLEVFGSKQTPELRLLGTSGTVTTLASVHLDLPQYDRKAVDGLIVPAASMREISTRLSTMSPEERRTLPCIGNERADLVVAGCAILEAILDIWPADRLGVADRGIREGILRGLMAADTEGFAAQAALRRLKQGGE